MKRLICLCCKRESFIKEIPAGKIWCWVCGAGMVTPAEYQRRKKIVGIKTRQLLQQVEDIGKKNFERQRECFKVMATLIQKGGPCQTIKRLHFEEGESIEDINFFIDELREGCNEVFKMMKSQITTLRKGNVSYL